MYFFYSTMFENNVLCIQNTNTYSWRVWQTKHNLLLTQIQKKLLFVRWCNILVLPSVQTNFLKYTYLLYISSNTTNSSDNQSEKYVLPRYNFFWSKVVVHKVLRFPKSITKQFIYPIKVTVECFITEKMHYIHHTK